MDMSYYAPQLFARTVNNRPEMLGGEDGLPDASNTFLAHNFVVLTSGALVAVASAAVLTCGLVLDASKASTAVDPPYSMFGDRHFPVNPRRQRFAVSVTDTSGHYGEADGAPQMSEVVIGTNYGIIKLSDGTHAMNVDNTTQDFFVVVEKPTVFNGVPQDADTYNPVVIVEILDAVIQPI